MCSNFSQILDLFEKSLPQINTIAEFAAASVTYKKSFITLTPAGFAALAVFSVGGRRQSRLAGSVA